jgi:hypothetical protein
LASRSTNFLASRGTNVLASRSTWVLASHSTNVLASRSSRVLADRDDLVPKATVIRCGSRGSSKDQYHPDRAPICRIVCPARGER